MNNFKKSLGYSTIICALLTSSPITSVNAENLDEDSNREEYLDQPITATEEDSLLTEIKTMDDTIEAMLVIEENMDTYQETDKLKRMLSALIETAKDEAVTYRENMEFDKAAETYSALLSLDLLASDARMEIEQYEKELLEQMETLDTTNKETSEDNLNQTTEVESDVDVETTKDKITDEQDLGMENKESEQAVFSLKSSKKSADTLYNEAVNAPYASQAWAIAIEGYELYPNDSRFIEAINQASRRMLIIGNNSHRDGNYSRAIEYYNEILMIPTVSENIRAKTATHKERAESKSQTVTADDYYNEALTASFASQAWSAANEGYELFPSDSRFFDAIAQASNRMMTIGTNSHRDGNYSRAIEYYNEILMTTVAVPKNIQRKAAIHKRQAENNSKIVTADDYYNEALTAPYASQAWSVATEGYNLYANDSRFLDAIAKASQRMATIGMNSHKNQDFSRALEYYNLLLETQEVPSIILNQVRIMKSHAENGIRLKTADEFYNEAKTSAYASNAWQAATEGYMVYPNDIRFVKAINEAAHRMFIIGKNNHNNASYKAALEYYDMLLNHTEVSKEIKGIVQIVKRDALNGEKIKTVNLYYQKTLEAPYASEAWDIAIEGSLLYQNDDTIKKALVEAANRQMTLGRSYEKSGDPARAKPYFDRIANQSLLPQSLRTLAASYSRLTQPNYRPVIFIDPGHGGVDSGAYFFGVKEATLNLSTARFLRDELIGRGYDVIMSRDTNKTIAMPERTKHANSVNTDLSVSIHYNSMGGRGTARGIETFIYHRVASGYGQETNRNNFLTDNPRIEDSLRLADLTHNQLISQTGMRQRYVKGQNFHMVREPHLPAVLYELGFLDNATELARVRQTSFHRSAAKAIADGIDQYFR